MFFLKASILLKKKVSKVREIAQGKIKTVLSVILVYL